MIGTVIRIMRKQKGLSQKELGDLLNLADTTVSAYELSKISPDFETIRRMANICGYDLCLLDQHGNVMDVEMFVTENE